MPVLSTYPSRILAKYVGLDVGGNVGLTNVALINVRDYGAVPAVTSDAQAAINTTAINAAFQAAFDAGGGTVIFPGMFWVTNVEVPDATIITIQGTSPVAGITQTATAAAIAGAILYFGNSCEPTIKDFYIKSDGPCAGGAAIFFDGCFSFNIENLVLGFDGGNLYNGITTNSAVQHTIRFLQLGNCQNDGIQVYTDGTYAGAGFYIDSTSKIEGCGRYGINIMGGIGGGYLDCYVTGGGIDSVHIEAVGGNDTNREWTFGHSFSCEGASRSGIRCETNSLAVLYITPGAICVGQSFTDAALYIGPQLAQTNPVETGSIVQITGARIQSNGPGIVYADNGVMILNDNDISYCGGTAVDLQASGANFRFTANGNRIGNNGGWGMSWNTGTQPVRYAIVGNMFDGNSSGALQNLTDNGTTHIVASNVVA